MMDEIEAILGRVARGAATSTDIHRVRMALMGRGAPEDLGLAAVKVARRIQSLSEDRIYSIILVKRRGEVLLSLEDRGKVECAGVRGRVKGDLAYVNQG